jgi:S-adenosylmethionine decarboxylase|tara:strand:+ start:84 stop:485 length:402 start_codon:yes stop_codon:yes gene_type:complete
MREFGQHLTIDASKCSREKLSDMNLVYDVLNKLPDKLGMTKMVLPQVVKWLDPGATIDGVSGFVMIAESHVSIHTFPEKDYVFMDIFSCRGFDVDKAVDLLTKVFGSKKFTKKVVKRGIDFPRSNPEYIYHQV